MSTNACNLNTKFAWRDHPREGAPKRSAQERIADFLEIHGLMNEVTVREQASRCIQCPNPSCVSGCPLCNPIPQWMQLTAEGRFLEAAAVLGSATNMAEICARLCPSERLCEHTCILDGITEPVSIASIEQFLADYAFRHDLVETSTPPPNGFKVAVLGSGPGALACADELVKLGYAVTVYDSALIPGGLLVNGTPVFKLDRSVVQRRIDLLKRRGVCFRLGQSLPGEHCLSDLRENFDAVYIGMDARQARTLEIPGANLNGVTQALSFLLQKNTPVPLQGPEIDLNGARVAVVGAGDVAIDSVRTALRCGAREVTCCYRRDEASMPCTPHEYKNAVEEGARFVFQAAPVGFLDKGDGWVRAVRFIRTERETDTAASFVSQPGTEFELEVDWVILALGFTAQPVRGFRGFEELATSESGGLLVDDNQQTNVPGVFAGGDLVRGPTLVLDTVRDGRNAAANIHRLVSSKVTAG